MNIERRMKVPTGDILVVTGAKGRLEMLSLGDYGQSVKEISIIERLQRFFLAVEIECTGGGNE